MVLQIEACISNPSIYKHIVPLSKLVFLFRGSARWGSRTNPSLQILRLWEVYGWFFYYVHSKTWHKYFSVGVHIGKCVGNLELRSIEEPTGALRRWKLQVSLVVVRPYSKDSGW